MVVFAARDRYVALIQDRAALDSEAGKFWAAMGITERWTSHWVHTQRYLSERAVSPAVAVATHRALTDVTRAEFAAIADMLIGAAVQGREPDDALDEVDRYLDDTAKPTITDHAGRIVASAVEGR